MRIKSRILFDMERMQAEKLLQPIKKSADKKYTLQVVELFNDTKEYDYLMNELNKLGIEITEQKENVYSQSEMNAALLLQIVPNVHCGYPQPEDGYLENSFYSDSGCTGCSYGWIQNKPLRLHKPKVGKNDIVGVWWLRELIITTRLKNIIDRENLTGYEVWPVIDHKKNIEFEDLFQLYITSELPPMNKQSNIVTRGEFVIDNTTYSSKCKKCGREECFLEGDVTYSRFSLSSIKDFSLSNEWFGSRMEIYRWPFASQRVYRLFQEHNIKGVRFIPVTVVD